MLQVFEAAAHAGHHASRDALQPTTQRTSRYVRRVFAIPPWRRRRADSLLPPALAENRLALRRLKEALGSRRASKLDAALRDAHVLIYASEATPSLQQLLGEAEVLLQRLLLAKRPKTKRAPAGGRAIQKEPPGLARRSSAPVTLGRTPSRDGATRLARSGSSFGLPRGIDLLDD